MPKIVDAEAIKIEIVKKAFNVFIEKGYYKTSMLDITQNCNMKRTTIYHYFKSKDEIFENTVYYVINILEKDINTIADITEMTLINKIKYLNDKWDKEFNNDHIVLLLVEMWFAIKREEGDMFERIQNRIKETNQNINHLVLEKAKYKVHTKKERLELIQYSVIMSILHQVSVGEGFINDSIISVISSL